MKKYLSYIIAVILAAFGLLTFYLSSSIIFDLFGIREKEGNYVLFVVWANFISSILYLISALGFIQSKKWTKDVLGISSIILIVAFIGLIIHIYSGGLYKTVTISAMIFRILITISFTLFAYFTITKIKHENNIDL